MKRGPFPMRPAFPTSETYDPLRPPLDHHEPLPGRAGIASRQSRRRRGRDGSPEFLGRPSARSTPTHAGGFLSARSRTTNAFHRLRRDRTGSAPPNPAPRRGRLTTLTQASHMLQTRAVDPAPLRTQPPSHARGHHYRGPRRLPAPNSHRQAALNLFATTSCEPPIPHDARAVPAHQPEADGEPSS